MFLSSSLITIAATFIPTIPAEPIGPFAEPQKYHGHDAHKPSHYADHESICNKYTPLILGSNAPINQRLLMALFVNTALVGNYTTPNTGIAVNGIMWPGEWNNSPINLMPWFNGDLASSNPCVDDCGHGVSVNWLDGGGPDALRQNLTSFEQGTNQ
jgi:hypothetical protein